MKKSDGQLEMFEEEAARSLLDQLLEESRLYKTSKDYFELLEFTKRLRNFAPFNAMLLHVQKPGLTYAASAYDWKTRFERRPKENVRPLLILWPFGPAALVPRLQRGGQEQDVLRDSERLFKVTRDRLLAAKRAGGEATVSELEARIDSQVFRLYWLTPEEVALIQVKP